MRGGGLADSKRTLHLAIPILLSCLLIHKHGVEAGSRYSSWTRKYNYGQNENYKSQYEYLYGNKNDQQDQKYQYKKYKTQTNYQQDGDGTDDAAGSANATEGEEEYIERNSYADDPGYSFFFEDTAGCAGSGYNLWIRNLTFTCGDGDYHGFDAYYQYDEDELAEKFVYDEDGNYLYPKRHYCQFDETITVKGTISSDVPLPVYVQVIPKICDGLGYSCSLPLLNSSYINFCDTIGACSDEGIYDQDFYYQFAIPGDGYVEEFFNEQARRLQEEGEEWEDDQEPYYGIDESYWENGQFVSKYGSRNGNHWITRYQLRVAFRPVDNFNLYKALNQNQGTENWEEEMEYQQQLQQEEYEYNQQYWEDQQNGKRYKYYARQSNNQVNGNDDEEEEEEGDDVHEDDYIDWQTTNQNREWRQEYYQTSKGHLFCFMHFGMVDHALNLNMYYDKTGYNKWVKWKSKWYEWGSKFLTYFGYERKTNTSGQQKKVYYCMNEYGWSEQDCIDWVNDGAGYVWKYQYGYNQDYNAEAEAEAAAASVGIIGLLAYAYRRHRKRRITTEEEEGQEKEDPNMIECTTMPSSTGVETESASNFILL